METPSGMLHFTIIGRSNRNQSTENSLTNLNNTNMWVSDISQESLDSDSDDQEAVPKALTEVHVHVKPFHESEYCIHYRLPHMESQSLKYPADMSKHLLQTVSNDILPLLEKTKNKVQDISLEAQKCLQQQMHQCRDEVDDPFFTASSHLIHHVQNFSNDLFTAVTIDLTRLHCSTELLASNHVESFLEAIVKDFSEPR